MGLNKINSVLFMSKTSKIQCMKFNSVNGTHVEDVKDIKIHVFLSFAAMSYSSHIAPRKSKAGMDAHIRRPRAGRPGLGGL